ncbi:MAG: lamin tail domain-containing protein [candidate division WOR-3 bacterium]
MASLVVFALIFPAQLVISEVMANPKGTSGAHMPEDRNEFVEVFNASGETIDLANYTITDGDATDKIVAWQDSAILSDNPSLVINSTLLKPGGYAVILDFEYTDTLASGGYVRPYRFGDSTLILTTGNTTIGDELANNDPLVLASPDGDTSTYGTPWNNTDSIPANAGDGFSWERINLLGPDEVGNWAISPLLHGTPGRPNAISTYFDLGVASLSYAEAGPPEPLMVNVQIKNYGVIASPSWTLTAWFSFGDTFARQENPPLMGKGETTFVLTTTLPKGKSEIWVKIVCLDDRDTTNNCAHLLFNPGGKTQFLRLAFSTFTPDGDGFDDSLPIMFYLPERGGKLTIKVFDLRGRCVRVLSSNILLPDEEGVCYWNGRNDNGSLVASGIYAVYLDYRYSKKRLTEKLPAVVVRK